MKSLIRNSILFLFFVLLAGNVFIFVSGISLSSEVNRFEADIARLHQENIDLEKKIFDMASLKNTASLAASLDFTQPTKTLILDNSKYALNR